MFASHQRRRMGRLIAVIDANDSQVDGPVSSVTTLEPLAEKWRAFGWQVFEIDGHDIDALATAFDTRVADAAPRVVIARTHCLGRLRSLPATLDAHFLKLDEPLRRALEQELSAELQSAEPQSRRARRARLREPPYATVLKPYGEALAAAGARAARDRVPGRRSDASDRDGSVPRRPPGALLQCRHGRGQHDRHRRGPGACRTRGVRQHLRRVLHAALLRSDRDGHRLPEAQRAPGRLHARALQSRRPEPSGHRRRRADARAAEHDGARTCRCARDPPGRRGAGRPRGVRCTCA